jgi:hypothetical protein
MDTGNSSEALGIMVYSSESMGKLPYPGEALGILVCCSEDLETWNIQMELYACWCIPQSSRHGCRHNGITPEF